MQTPAQVVRDRERIVGSAVFEAGRQRTGDEVAVAVREFGLQNAGGAGSDEHADASGAPTQDGLPQGVLDVVLAQREFRQTIVAAVEARERRGQPYRVDTADLADMGIDGHGLERTDFQAAASCQQGFQRFIVAQPDAAGCREAFEEKTYHRSIPTLLRRSAYAMQRRTSRLRTRSPLPTSAPCTCGLKFKTAPHAASRA